MTRGIGKEKMAIRVGSQSKDRNQKTVRAEGQVLVIWFGG